MTFGAKLRFQQEISSNHTTMHFYTSSTKTVSQEFFFFKVRLWVPSSCAHHASDEQTERAAHEHAV